MTYWNDAVSSFVSFKPDYQNHGVFLPDIYVKLRPKSKQDKATRNKFLYYKPGCYFYSQLTW